MAGPIQHAGYFFPPYLFSRGRQLSHQKNSWQINVPPLGLIKLERLKNTERLLWQTQCCASCSEWNFCHLSPVFSFCLQQFSGLSNTVKFLICLNERELLTDNKKRSTRCSRLNEVEKGEAAQRHLKHMQFLLLLILPRTRHSGVKLLCK